MRGTIKVALVAKKVREKAEVVRTCEERRRVCAKNGRCTGTSKEMERKIENQDLCNRDIMLWKMCG